MMRNSHHTILTALAATAVLAFAISTATARNLRTSEKNHEIKWASLEFTAAGAVTRCPLTLLGRVTESTIAKRIGSKTGGIRHGEIGTCTGGTVTLLAETLPWETSYQGFTGTLPRIATIEVSLIGARFKVHPNGLSECLAGTTNEHPAGGIESLSSGVITGLRADETRRIPLGGGFACSLAGESTFAGSASVTNLPGTASITVTLI